MANIKILVIDYEPRGIKQLREPLEKAGYDVHVAQDGVSGIDAFERLKPDLTLVEAMLPKRHGFEVCQELKKTAHGSKTPVVIVTSVYRGRKYRTQALHNYGCDEYLEKPLSEETLLGTVRRLVKGSVPTAKAQEKSASAGTGRAPAEDNEDAEAEILQRLDEILPGDGPGGGSGPNRASAEVEPRTRRHGEIENVVAFDPERARAKRRAETATPPGAAGAAHTPVARGSAEPASMLARHEAVAAQEDRMTARHPEREAWLDEAPRPLPAADVLHSRWMWGVVLLLVLAATAALAVLLWPR